MNPQRFHKIVPEARADDFEIVTANLPAFVTVPWKVVYDGRDVTSGSADHCLRWVAAFRKVIG